jgi:hypothetical protein
MKLGSRRFKDWLYPGEVQLALTLALAMALVNCGKPASSLDSELSDPTPEPEVVVEATPEPSPSPTPDAGMRAVVGEATFRSQCPWAGYVSEPRPSKIVAWECPVNMTSLELAQPPQTLLVFGDCTKMTVTIRTADGKLTAGWETMADGSFSVDGMEAGSAILKNDGSGNASCTSYMKVDVWGKMNCLKPDKPIIQLYSDWKLGKGKLPSGTLPKLCKLPEKCFLQTMMDIHQCQ